MIKIFFDTNIIQGQMYNKDYALENFSLNRNLDKVIEVVDQFEIKDITRIIIPEIVIKEIRQHKIEEFNKHKLLFIQQCENFKMIFGDCIKINKSDLVDIEFYIKKLDFAIENYIKNIKDKVTVSKLSKNLDYIINKAIAKEPLFRTTKGVNKEFTDSGLKDHMIYETIIENYDIGEDLLILYSKDKDFDDIPKELPIIRVSEIESLKTVLINHSPEARLKYIIRLLNESDSIMNIKGYIKENSFGHIDLFNNCLKIIQIIGNIEINEDTESINLEAKCDIDSKNKKIEIEITYPDFEVVNAILKE